MLFSIDPKFDCRFYEFNQEPVPLFYTESCKATAYWLESEIFFWLVFYKLKAPIYKETKGGKTTTGNTSI